MLSTNRIRKFLSGPSGIGAIFLVIGIAIHHIVWLCTYLPYAVISGKLKLAQLPGTILMSGIGPYIILVLLCLGVSNAPLLVGGGLGILAGEMIDKFVYMPILVANSTALAGSGLIMGLGFMQYKLLVLGAVLGWIWSRIFTHPLMEQPEVTTEAEIADSTTAPPSMTAKVLFLLGLVVAGLPLIKAFEYGLGEFLVATWNAVPFLVWYLVARKAQSDVTVAISGSLLLLYNLYMTVSLYFAPVIGYTGAQIASAMFPAIGIILVLPGGLLIGWIVSIVFALAQKVLHLNTSSVASIRKVSAGILVAGSIILLGSYKSLIKLVNVEARIGEPRIVVGGETIKKTPTTIDGWLAAGNFDDDPQEELAAVGYHSLKLLDTHDFSVKKEWPLPEVLTRRVGFGFGAFPVRLQPGGPLFLMNKFDGTLVDLAGNVAWTFKYATDSSSVYSMSAADLDNDNNTEFYVGTFGGVYRLDSAGRVIWKAERGTLHVYPLAARGGNPAMILTANPPIFYLLDMNGKLLREFRFDKADFEPSVIVWGDSYCVVAGKTSYDGPEFYLFDLTGKTVLEGKVSKDMGYKEALAVQFDPAEKPFLAVHAGVGGSVDRQELDIFSFDGQLVYKDILKSNALLRAATDHINGRGYIMLGSTKYEKAFPEAKSSR